MKRSTKSLYAERWTKTREPHRQIWPWFANEDRTLPAMAASRSASAKMIFGFFPPSSSETFLNNGAHASATLRPVTVPPVNEIVLIFGYAVIGVSSLGLAMAVFPTAVAGAIFQLNK